MTVWITGGGSGIGAALARRLAQDGQQVVISGRVADDLSDVAAGQPGILPFPLDISDGSAVRNGVQRIERDIAPISLAVLALGSAPIVFSAFERDRLRHHADDALGAAINCMGALMPVLRQRGGGHIAILPPSDKVEASRLAVLIQTLNKEMAGSGVTFQVIDPSLFQGPATDQAADRIWRRLRAERGVIHEKDGFWGFIRRMLRRLDRPLTR